MRVLALCLLLCCARLLQATPEYTLSVCAIFQNEAEWLKEWVEFHKLVGVEHFFLYNHLSQDNYAEVLEPYIASGEVELIQWDGPTQIMPQHRAYNHCLWSLGHRSTWIAFIDIDEFLFPVEEASLLAVLKDYEEVGGLSVNFQVFGTSGVQNLEEGDLLIERLTRCARRNHPLNRTVKCILHPDRVIRILTPHQFLYRDGWHAVDSNKEEVILNSNPRIPVDRIRINHYQLRTLDWTYGERFIRMRKPERDETGTPVIFTRDAERVQRQIDWIESCANETEDWTIFRFIEPLKHHLGLVAVEEDVLDADTGDVL